MIELIREKFPIFLLIIVSCLLLLVGKSFYDHQFATTKYKGVVVNKGYELPTSGYKSFRSLNKNVRWVFSKIF